MSREIIEQGMRDAQNELRDAARKLRLVVHYLPAGEPIDALYHARRALSATQTFFVRLDEEEGNEEDEN